MRAAMEAEYEGSTDGKLLALHKGVEHAYLSDRSMSTAMQRAAQCFGSPLTYYGVDEFPDLKIQGEVLEAELNKRRIAFTPIQF